jgi:ABC-type branched-subunit amino acid transport system substrate-binding protein
MRSKALAAVLTVALVGAFAAVVPAGATSRKAKFTGDPIKIGLTYTCDAAIPPSICEAAPSGQAAAKAINAAGGVKTADGATHKVAIVLCNNKNDRAKMADCARQFVDEKVAFATGGATNAEEVLPILATAGIAYFGPVCISNCTAEGNADNAYILGFTLGLFQGLTKELTDAGFKKIVEVAQGAGVAIGGLTSPIAEAGGASVKVVEAPLDNPNWAQIAEDATQDADIVMTIVDETNTKAFIDAYNQAGKTTPVTSVIGIITNDLIASTGGPKSPLKGNVSTGYFPPVQDKAWADYRKGMKKYSKGTQLEPAGQQMWMAVQLAATIMEGINGPVTAASFKTAVDGTTDVPTLGGKLPAGMSFQEPEGIFPRIFNNDYWGPLKINGKTIGNAKGAAFTPAPSAG